MGSKTVIFCDLCKLEGDEENLYSLNFKKPGKRTGHKYEVCSSCAEKVQMQLVSEKELNKDWGFGVGEKPTGQAPDPPQSVETAVERRQRLQQELTDDDEFVISKRSEAEKIRQRIASSPKIKKQTGEGCLHYNKTGPSLKEINGQQTFVRTCRDCKEVLPVRSAEERHRDAQETFE